MMTTTRFQMAAIAMLLAGAASGQSAVAKTPPNREAPSFNCAKARPGSIDLVICASRELSILDREMAKDYQRAQAETPRALWPEILAEQREFIRSRNQCMGGKEKRHACIAFSYESRLQRLADWIDGSWRD